MPGPEPLRLRADWRTVPAVRRLPVTTAGLALAVVLTGCGSSRSADQGGQASATPASASQTQDNRGSAQPNCALVPASLVNAALSADVGNPVQTVNSVVTVCEFSGQKAGHVTVRFQTSEDAASFAAGRKGFDANGEPTKDVAGFADQAYSSTLGSGDLALVSAPARAQTVNPTIRPTPLISWPEAAKGLAFSIQSVAGSEPLAPQ